MLRSRPRARPVIASALAALLLAACQQPDPTTEPGPLVCPATPATDAADAAPTPEFGTQPPETLVVEQLADAAVADSHPSDVGDYVRVCYTGRAWSTGEVFDSSQNRQPFPFQLGVGQVIRGWDVGMVGLRVGEQVRLIIPPDMAYGDTGAGTAIGPNETLVFDVEIMEIIPADDVEQTED